MHERDTNLVESEDDGNGTISYASISIIFALDWLGCVCHSNAVMTGARFEDK